LFDCICGLFIFLKFGVLITLDNPNFLNRKIRGYEKEINIIKLKIYLRQLFVAKLFTLLLISFYKFIKYCA